MFTNKKIIKLLPLYSLRMNQRKSDNTDNHARCPSSFLEPAKKPLFSESFKFSNLLHITNLFLTLKTA